MRNNMTARGATYYPELEGLAHGIGSLKPANTASDPQGIAEASRVRRNAAQAKRARRAAKAAGGAK